ncbi:MAG: patatin-like phospholipase family protein [Chloroflexota bacterium]
MDISLALGGGGAKGNAHIGVLRRLEQEGFRIRAVAGTSFGGLVAVFYAAGFGPDEIEARFSKVDQSRLFGRGSGEGPSLLGLAGVTKFLEESFGGKTFDDLRLPCAVTAVDLKSAREVILNKGPLRDAVLATIALPSIFPPRRIRDWDLVDGGTLDPVPVSVARGLAPGLPVAAVVLSSPVGAPTHSHGVTFPGLPAPIARRLTGFRLAQAFEIFMQALDISSRELTELRLQADAPEVIVRPDVSQIQLLDKVDVSAVAKLGEQALDEVLPDLRRVAAWPARLARSFRRRV